MIVENYPDFSEPIRSAELTSRMAEQAKRFRAVIREVKPVKDVGVKDYKKIVVTDAASTSASRLLLLLAAGRGGSTSREGEFEGRSVSYCAVRDGFFFKGKTVAVVGEVTRPYPRQSFYAT